MGATANLLDTVRERCSMASDNAISVRLGVSRSLVSEWRKGSKPIPDERIAQLCKLAHEDGPSWAARIHAERASSDAERNMWRETLRRLGTAAALAIALFGSGLGTAPAPAQTTDHSAGGMHIMSN